MALTLDNILTVAQIGTQAQVGATDVDVWYRNRAITIGALAMGLDFTGDIEDTNNPFLSTSRIEDVIMLEDSDTMQLRYSPITAVTYIYDADGNDLEYTEITDYFIRDIDTSDSDAIRRFTGKLIKRIGKWSKGFYRVSYTAGFSSTNFPEGIRTALAIIGAWLYLIGGDFGILSKKSYQKMVQYQASLVPRNNMLIPKQAALLLDHFRPASL